MPDEINRSYQAHNQQDRYNARYLFFLVDGVTGVGDVGAMESGSGGIGMLILGNGGGEDTSGCGIVCC